MSKPIQKIVFVDDDKIQHMINKKNLLRLKEDLDLYFFESPYEALDWMGQNEADLLILHVNMPEMRGWDFLDKLKEMDRMIQVKMLTSSVDPDDVAISMNYNMVSGFLVKPLRNEVMSEILGI